MRRRLPAGVALRLAGIHDHDCIDDTVRATRSQVFVQRPIAAGRARGLNSTREGREVFHSTQCGGAQDGTIARTMDITERIVDAITILDLSGKLTIGEGAQLLKDKSESLAFQGRTSVIMNLAGVPYIDSGGLGQLVACYTTLAKAGGRLTLLNVGARNHDLLSITKLVSVFETFDTEAEALAGYAATRLPEGLAR